MAIRKKRKSNRTCSVLNCNSQCSRRVSIFLFPKNEKLKQKWASVLKLGKPVTPYMYVCSLHFRKDDILTFPGISSRRRRLKRGVIPSQKLPESPGCLISTIKNEPISDDERIETKNMLHADDNAQECRSCYQKFDYDAGLLHLFQAWDPPWNGMGNTIAEDLAALASVEISITDPYSKLICPMCHLKLLDACTFVANVRLNDRIMRERRNDYAPEETTWPKPIQVNRDMNNTVLENAMAVEVKQEAVSEDECGDINEPEEDTYKETDYNNLEIKTEPEDITEPPNIQITVNGTITLDQFAQNSLTNGDIKPYEQCVPQSKVKEEPHSGDEDAEMTPDLPLDCLLCTKNFNSVSGLKAHVISQHSYETVERKTVDISPIKKEKHVCSTCRCSFATPTDLMVHETRHNEYSCYLCNAKCETFELLTKHRKKCKAKPHSNTLQKPKTLKDVKRAKVASLQFNKKIDLLAPESPDSLHKENRTSPNVKVHLKIHSISENDNTVDSKNNVKMKTEHLDINFSEEKIKK